MKVNPEYLSFTVHQSNSGMPFFVAGGVILIIALCLAVWAGVTIKDSLVNAVGVFVIGVLLAVMAFCIGNSINNQIKGNIQEIETATGAQIISIGDYNNNNSHKDIVLCSNDNQVNLIKNVSYIKHGKVYTNGVIVITHGKGGLFNNEEELKPILAKK